MLPTWGGPRREIHGTCSQEISSIIREKSETCWLILVKYGLSEFSHDPDRIRSWLLPDMLWCSSASSFTSGGHTQQKKPKWPHLCCGANSQLQWEYSESRISWVSLGYFSGKRRWLELGNWGRPGTGWDELAPGESRESRIFPWDERSWCDYFSIKLSPMVSNPVRIYPFKITESILQSHQELHTGLTHSPICSQQKLRLLCPPCG